MKKVKDIAITMYKLKLKTILAGSLFIIIFAYLISLATAPLHKKQAIKNLVNSDTLFFKKHDTLYYHSEMEPLIKDKTYKEALLKLSESDSIQLAINLIDSTVNLTLKGVTIHQTKIAVFEKDKLFKRLQLREHVRLFSEPLAVHQQYATIVKEPVVVRQAPKDSIEAALNAYKPDTLIQNPAFLILSVNQGVLIIIEQDISLSSKDKWQKFNFYYNFKIQAAINSISNFVHFKKQEYYPTIIIKMPANDLRAIYRALPSNAFIAINL